jgi:hypothetical protein
MELDMSDTIEPVMTDSQDATTRHDEQTGPAGRPAAAGPAAEPLDAAAQQRRRTAFRERAHSIGVESTTHTSSDHRLVSSPRARISQFKVPASFRSRLL